MKLAAVEGIGGAACLLDVVMLSSNGPSRDRSSTVGWESGPPRRNARGSDWSVAAAFDADGIYVRVKRLALFDVGAASSAPAHPSATALLAR